MTEGTTDTTAQRGRPRAWDAMGHAAFRRFCVASYLDSFGTWAERLAVGWFVLDTTGSVFLAALSFAARSAPNMFLGPLGGAVADRFHRPRVLMLSTSVKSALTFVLAIFGLMQLDSAWPVLMVVALSSVARTSEQATIQALIGDIVGPARAPGAISLHASGVRIVALVASAGGGFLLAVAGPGPVFLMAGSTAAIAAFVYSTLRVARPARPHSHVRRSLWGDAVEGLRVALQIPVVLTLLLLAVAIEVFAFSYQSLMPAVADRVLRVDASGFGLLTFAGSLGGVLGMLALTQLIDVVRRGWLLAVVTMVFAVSLLALAVSDRILVSLGLMVAIGSMAAMFDALQWALLQASVPDEVRGRVIGLWTTAIGFGWLGPVILGATAEVFGTRSAIAVGGAVALLAAGIAAGSPRLRRL
ncbi:MAG: MFS transporter [Chloroflexi bacterium]|nr:MAG: MFS transporter [Chloroflexota bacterium]